MVATRQRQKLSMEKQASNSNEIQSTVKPTRNKRGRTNLSNTVDEKTKKTRQSHVANKKNKEEEATQHSVIEEKNKEEKDATEYSTLIRKGKGLVDPLSNLSETGRVVEDSDGTVWSCMLNQTDISYGIRGHNKFYMIQLIKTDVAVQYYLFCKWGRVGAKTPQKSLNQFSRLDVAKSEFRNKFYVKTGNIWEDKPFVPKATKYVMIDINYDNEDSNKNESVKNEILPKEIPSKLHPTIQNLVKLICNLDIINNEVSELRLDLKRMPLGKLSKKQLLEGYQVLSDISNLLTSLGVIKNANDGASPVTKRRGRKQTKSTDKEKRTLAKELTELCNRYYTIIPHNFGMQLPTKIDTPVLLKEEMDLLAVLTDLEITEKILHGKEEKKVNKIDLQHQAIGATMTPLEETSPIYNLIRKYVEESHGPTHSNYSLTIDSIIEVERNGEQESFDSFKSIGNHQLLWHGSRLSNYVSIISQGLRIAPPEAPSTGYMFGKGVYFADCVSKSANYCWASKNQPKGILVLCQVALGKTMNLFHADNVTLDRLKTKDIEYHSVKGCGGMQPAQEGFGNLPDGTTVPYGRLEHCGAQGALLYNEYIIYNTKQVKMRYLVTVNFNFV